MYVSQRARWGSGSSEVVSESEIKVDLHNSTNFLKNFLGYGMMKTTEPLALLVRC